MLATNKITTRNTPLPTGHPRPDHSRCAPRLPVWRSKSRDRNIVTKFAFTVPTLALVLQLMIFVMLVDLHEFVARSASTGDRTKYVSASQATITKVQQQQQPAGVPLSLIRAPQMSLQSQLAPGLKLASSSGSLPMPGQNQNQPQQPVSPSSATTRNNSAEMSSIETGRLISKILNDFFDRGYDKRVRPNYGGPPVNVNVTMRILSISSVSEVMMDFTADFYFRQTWVDPRLSFIKKNNVTTLYVGAEVSKRIWLPDTFFGNEKMAYFHEATTPNVFLRIDHTGEVYRSIRLTVTSSCPMKLQYFPMDRQQCTIEAESYGYNVKDINYQWARSTAVERDKTISLPQFDIIRTEQKTRIEELSSGTYSRLVAEIHFARRMGYYLIQIYIPSSLIVVISWVSFWLHRNASPARVQLGVTTVLTMTTLMSSTNAALPKISYVKSIDVFLGTCFVMVFAALLEYATVGYLGKRIAMRKAHAQNVLNHAVAMTQRMVAAQNQANLMTTMNNHAAHPTGTTTNISTTLNNHQLAATQQGGPMNYATINNNNNNNTATSPASQFQKDHHHHQHHSNQPIPPPPPPPPTSAYQQQQQQQNHHHHHHLNHHQQQQQPNVVEQFINAAASLPSLVNHNSAKLDPTILKRPAPPVMGLPLLGGGPLGSRLIDRKLGKLPKGKQLDSIFGVRPSSIDKYSRVVFPVCFVCFQLMYWIVYLHISAFLESDQLENK